MATGIWRALNISLFLYGICLLVSMAGMELFGWLTWVLAVAAVLCLPKNKRVEAIFPKVFRQVDWALGGFLIVIIIGLLRNTPPPVDYLEVLGSVRWVVLFFGLRAAALHVADEKWFFRLVQTWAVMTCLIGAYALVQHVFGVDIVRWDYADVQPMDNWPWGKGKIYRAVGFLGSPMTYGHSVAMLSCFLLGVWAALGPFRRKVPNATKASRPKKTASLLLNLDANRTWQKWLLAGAIFGFIGLCCSYTRGAWLGAAAAIIFMGWLLNPKALFAAFVSLVLAGAILLQVNPSVRRRFDTIYDGKTQSFLDRIQIWTANWNMFTENPIFGVGYGENERLLSSYYEKLGLEGQLGHAHNTFLQILAGTGLTGFILFAYFILFMFVMCLREYKRAERPLIWASLLGILGAQIALQIGGLTECNFKDAEVNHLYLFLAAVASSFTAHRRSV